MKTWRQGGPPPKVPLNDFRDILVNGYLMDHDELKSILNVIIKKVDAYHFFSSREGGLVPFHSFIEELKLIVDDLTSREEEVYYNDLPWIVLRSALPSYCEMISFKDYGKKKETN